MGDADHKQGNDASETGASGLSWHENDMPFSNAFQDHFYSRADGRAECDHVFIAANRLPERWRAGGTLAIGELGFGTGLNFCETLRQWKRLRPAGARLSFTSFERYPMTSAEIDRALSRWPEIAEERRALVSRWPGKPSGTVEIGIDPQTRLAVHCGDALASLTASAERFDAWYLDGFAPSRNPDMWSAALMQAVFDHTGPGGTFGTYAAAGFVRRNLEAAGFSVSRQSGFAGKREMLAGKRPETP
ncbi:tRNA (5-methylaminomethyl-2-thiouridine)(34)-methyltransferase MnmD [Martelella sp. AD-3]|uniref:tRNA (5-methylaminomethyl-2-thiouridine)(34)-methyltransferase MnmD n=1 Tax=Martelella sp. AD-3 TaxID=686597 RepID=UPI0004648496|nr:tRNA (5-methylaminomethyl-2-thiouridine)(34)-methyltransferase MnmD [Martelella sp. AD-3]AMM83592.1 5-methylaminomethyl-2-thiouridine methyltransferase [Martelella sp. AD-3]MAM11623.1 5-methylaminomethyl-2-thiouridine methyltransferase [Rhizobiaceae bacterium]